MMSDLWLLAAMCIAVCLLVHKGGMIPAEGYESGPFLAGCDLWYNPGPGRDGGKVACLSRYGVEPATEALSTRLRTPDGVRLMRDSTYCT